MKATHPRLLFPVLFWVVCFLVWRVTPALATTRTWTGASSPKFWSVPGNWNPTGVPANGDTLIFPGNFNATNDFVNLRVFSIQFSGPNASSLYGNGIQLDSDITAAHSSGEARVFLDITFSTGGGTFYTIGNGTLNIENNIHVSNNAQLILFPFGTNIVLQGAIQGSGDLVKLGSGDAWLQGTAANTYSGLTSVQGGTLHLNKSSGAQAISTRVFVGDQTPNQSTLVDEFGGQYPAAFSMVVSSNGIWGITNGASVTNLTIDAGGRIAGSGLLTLGSDVNILPGSNPSFFTYAEIDCPIYLGSQTRTFFFAFAPLQHVQLYVQGPIIGPGPGPGSPGIVKDGGGELYLLGANIYYGPTTIKDGVVACFDSASLGGSGSGAETFVGEDGILDLNGVPSPITIPETLVLSNSSYVTFSGSVTLTAPLTLPGACSFEGDDNSAFLNITNSVSGGSFTVSGGTVRLSGSTANTMTGGIYVGPYVPYRSQATLELAKPDNVAAVSCPVTVQGYGTNTAVLRNLQNGGVSDVTLWDSASWLINGHIVAANSVKFYGSGLVDTAAGHLQFTTSGTNTPLQVLTNDYPATNYTAQISGHVDFLAATNDAFVDSGLALNMSAQAAGAGTIRKDGAGTLLLSANNSFTGPLLVGAGTVWANASNALGSSSSGTVVSNGATLLINGTNMVWVAEPLNIQGSGVGGTNGALTCYLSPVITNGLVLSGPATINTPSNTFLYIQTAITGTGPLTKTGAGTLSFIGAQKNTYSGDTLINQGTFQPSKSGTATCVPGNLAVGAGGVFGGTAATVTCNQNNAVAGSTVTVNGGSLYDLANFNQSLGQLTLNDGGDVHTGTGVLSFYLGGPSVTVGSEFFLGLLAGSTITGKLNAPGASLNFHVTQGAFSLGVPELDVPATISSAGTIVKDGPGALRLSASNNLAYVVNVNEGRLIANNPSSLSGSTNMVSVSSNGTLVVDGGIKILNKPLHLGSAALPAFDSTSGSNVWNGAIFLDTDSTFSVSPTNGYLQVLNTVGGSGGLTKIGPGTLQFWGFAPNTYTGLTTVSAGTIEAGRVNLTSIPGDAVIGDDSTGTTVATIRSLREQQFSLSANVTVNRSGLLDLFPFPGLTPPQATLQTVTGAGELQLGTGTSLTVSNDVSFLFSGTIQGSGALNKQGTATFRLTGNSPNFTGPTTVSNGDYKVDGSIPNSAVTVGTSAALRGDGVVGNVTAGGSSSLVEADSNVPGRLGGDLEVGDLSLSPGGVVGLTCFGPSSTGGNDILIARGAVSLGNGTLSTGFQYPPREGDVVTLIRKDSAGAINGVFAGWPEGTIRKVGGVTVRATYSGGDGNDFTITVTNVAVAFSSYRLAEGNGNQTVEPDECNLLFVSLLNRRTNSVVLTNALLRAITPGAQVTIANSTYPTIAAGAVAENVTPFQFRTDPTLACGSTVQFELDLGVLNEGEFGVTFTPLAGSDCTHPTGGCQSCDTASGTFSATNPPETFRPLYFAGGPSLCYPEKHCPGIDPVTSGLLVPYLAHSFTNNTTNLLCLTAVLHPACPGAPTNALGLGAYLNDFDYHDPCSNYLGDSGDDGTQAFSFQVPAGSNFVLMVSARTTNVVCDSYTLELYGLLCGAPILAIAQEATPSKVRLSWSTAVPGFTAQQAGRLGGAFTNLPQLPVILGGRYSITNITTTTNQFYRLKK